VFAVQSKTRHSAIQRLTNRSFPAEDSYPVGIVDLGSSQPTNAAPMTVREEMRENIVTFDDDEKKVRDEG